MSSRPYFVHLDLLRVFFVFVVLLHHWIAENPFAFLPFGSTIAFVLSGFLLTGPLLKGKKHIENYWQTTLNFLGRRFLRTLPVYFIVLTIYIVFNKHDFRQNLVYYLTFTQNYLIAYNTDPLNQSIGFMQSWSLAIQEQFYIAIPILIYLIPNRFLESFFILLGILGLAFRLWYFYMGFPFTYNHFTTECCMDCFGIGALISFYHNEKPEKLKRILTNKGLFWSIAVLYALSILGYFNTGQKTADIDNFHLYNNLYRITERTFVSLFSIWFIGWGIYFPSNRLNAISSSKVIRYLSKISYGVYIYHLMVSLVIIKVTEMIDPGISKYAWWIICLNFIFTIIASAISYELIERPFLSLKDKYFTDKTKILRKSTELSDTV